MLAKEVNEWHYVIHMKRTVSQQSDVNGDCSARFPGPLWKIRAVHWMWRQQGRYEGVITGIRFALSGGRAPCKDTTIDWSKSIIWRDGRSERPWIRRASRIAQWDTAGRGDRFLPHFETRTPHKSIHVRPHPCTLNVPKLANILDVFW